MPAKTIGFRPSTEDERILAAAAATGETTSTTIRRALRLLAHEQWLDQFHHDALAMKDENLNDEPDAW
jgi:antitoxin ParD1/3/4